MSGTDAIVPGNSQNFTYDELNRLSSAQSLSYAPDTALPPAGLTYGYDPVRTHVLKTTSDGRTFLEAITEKRGIAIMASAG